MSEAKIAEGTGLAGTPGYALSPACEEIRDAIKFYEERGLDWLPVVAYLSAKAWGIWPRKKGQWEKRNAN